MLSRREAIVGVATASTLAIAGCSSSDPDKEEIRNVMQQQAEAMEAGDIEEYMDTMHPESPAYDRTRSSLQQLLSQYNFQIEYEINSIEIDGDTATADVTQETRIEDPDPDFQANRITVTNEFRTYDGDWYLYDSTTESVERL